MENFWKDKNWLNEQYWENELSLAKIAKRVGCSQNTVKYWMEKYNIPRRDAPEGAWRKDGYKIIPPNNQELYPLIDDKNWLTMQHWGFDLCLQDIGKLVSPTLTSHDIVEAMERLKIPMWSMSNLISDLHIIEKYHYPDWLVEQHYDNGLSMVGMSGLSGASVENIRQLMHSYNLPVIHQIEHTERDEQGRRWCFSCRRWLDVAQFHKNIRETDGLHAKCKKCRIKHGLELREIERAIALQIYSKGAMNCELCGCDDLNVLTFDHIEGGGYKHKKIENIGGQFNRWLKRNGYPDGFRVLCRNCQHTERLRLLGKYKWNSDKDYSVERRILALQIYSDGYMKCAKCGNENIDVLVIDHVDGGGGKHRLNIKTMLDAWLKRNKYPDGFRILCHNCNYLEYLKLLN